MFHIVYPVAAISASFACAPIQYREVVLLLKDRKLAVNTMLLTASGLALRFVGMVWQIWLVSRIGEAGIGLFQLIMSVAALAATVAVSGSRYTTTRLVSEETGLERPHGAAQALTVCMLYGLFFGLAAGTILLFLAEPLGFLWLGDARTVRPLMLLALEMPLTGLDSVMHGYFTAVGRVWKSVCIAIAQQLVTIGITVLLFTAVPENNLELACLAITAGRLIGALLETLAMAVVYMTDRLRYGIRRRRDAAELSGMTDRALSAALPLAAASYARSGLSTVQHLLVPRGLRASGLAAAAAMAGYGIIQGMALPVVLFPSCVMVAVAELIVPKLTEQQVRQDTEGIRGISESILENGLKYAAICAALFIALGDSLGMALYHTPDAGVYIRLFALIVPVMYLDMLADGCLKGLGEMMFCMYVNIADAGLSALLVWLLLPHWGLPAYISVICFTEIFNFVLSILRLRRVAGIRVSLRRAGGILLWAGFSGGAAWLLLHTISAGNGVPALIFSCVSGLAVYAAGVISPAGGAGRQASGKRCRRYSLRTSWRRRSNDRSRRP